MSNLQQNGKHNRHAFILAPFHVCDELVKLHGLWFHFRKIIIEETKTPSRTLVNKLSTSAVANDQQSMQKISSAINNVRSRLPAAPIEEQSPIQNINRTFSNAVISKKKNIALFFPLFLGGDTSRDKNGTSNFPVEEEKNKLKSIPWHQSQSAESLRHSNVRGIWLWLCYNSRRYQRYSSKQR